MDISIIGKNSLKIKGKLASFIIDPSSVLPKTNADATILLDGFDNIDLTRAIDSRLVINGQGEYEVGGVKISGVNTTKGTIYKLIIDDVSVVVGISTDSKTDGLSASVVVINADTEFNESSITALEPKITVLYGDKKLEAAKTLGAESVIPVSKITVTKDKLPEKMEIVVLG